MYKVEHGNYYSGSALLAPDGGIGYKSGSGIRGDCGDYADDRDQGLNNRLGFRPQACGQLRYFYQLRPGNVAVAFAYADAEGRYIYPDCHGGGSEECDYTRGDAVRMALRDAKPTVCRNITKYCPAGLGAPPPPPPTPPPPPDPPCPCTAILTPGTWSPAVDLTTKYECESFVQTRLNTWAYTPDGRGACVVVPCPASTSQTQRRTVWGTRPFVEDATAAVCVCSWKPPETRAVCSPCTLASSTEGPCTWSPGAPASLLTCAETVCTKSITHQYTPPPPTCPDQTSTRREDPICGTQPPVCSCEAWTPPSPRWGPCTQVDTDDDGNPICKQRAGNETRDCTNPCSVGTDICPASIPAACATSRPTTPDEQACRCPAVEKKCDSDSDFPEKTLEEAKNIGCNRYRIFHSTLISTDESTELYTCRCLCETCPEGEIFTSWDGADHCDCYNPIVALGACNKLSSFKLGEVQNILLHGTKAGGGRAIPNDCIGYSEAGFESHQNPFSGDLVGNMPGENARAQQLWWDYFHAGNKDKSKMSAPCRRAINAELGPEHPVLEALNSSKEYLFEALDRCSAYDCASGFRHTSRGRLETCLF